MKFRADVYNEIFHKEDTQTEQARIVKPDPQAEKKEKSETRAEEKEQEKKELAAADDEDQEEQAAPDQEGK